MAETFQFVESDILDYPLIFYGIIILAGIFVSTPFSQNINDIFSSKKNRVLIGLMLVIAGGYMISAHTFWLHQKYNEMGGSGGCSAFSVFSCQDVISNSLYNSDPLLGMPWGILGMIAFSVMAIISISVFRDSEEKWVQNWLTFGTIISGFGILIAVYLIYLEIFKMGVFCQYCTGAHIADIVAFAMFYYLLSMKESDEWKS